MLKLLMITRKVDVNDALAGFTYDWVKEIGGNLEKLYVVSWQAGNVTDLPENIEVIFLSDSKLKKVFILWFKLFKILPKIDGVFCHMNPEYTILVGPLARLFGKRIVSWYTHKAVTVRRRILEILANKIITASSESFRDPWFAKKVAIIGHGINTDLFKPKTGSRSDSQFRIISVGRISPTKDYESIIKSTDLLDNKSVQLKIVGDVILKSQKAYFNELKEMVAKMDLADQVDFPGWIANRDMVPYYQESDLFINTSGTGSVDKVVLEAMACGCLVLTSNEAFESIIGSEFMVEKNNPKALAEKISWLMNIGLEEKTKILDKFRQIILDGYDLKKLAKKIVNQFEK